MKCFKVWNCNKSKGKRISCSSFPEFLDSVRSKFMIDGRSNVTIVDEDGCEVEEDSLLHLPENTSLFFLKDGEVLVSGQPNPMAGQGTQQMMPPQPTMGYIPPGYQMGPMQGQGQPNPMAGQGTQQMMPPQPTMGYIPPGYQMGPMQGQGQYYPMASQASAQTMPPQQFTNVTPVHHASSMQGKVRSKFMIDGRSNVTIVDEDGCEVEEDSLLHLPENTSLFFLKDGEVLVSGQPNPMAGQGTQQMMPPQPTMGYIPPGYQMGPMQGQGQPNPMAGQGTQQMMPPQPTMGYIPPGYQMGPMQGQGQYYPMASQASAQTMPPQQFTNVTPVHHASSMQGKENEEIEGLIVVASGTTPQDLSAASKVKNGLHKVKVSRHDATELQRKLEGELFDKWEEKYEQMEATDIAMTDLDPFLNQMTKSYEGIDSDLIEKCQLIQWSGQWSYKILEFKYNKSDTSEARYGMLAFGKSPDKKSIDCMYVLYKMNFKVAPQVIVTTKEHSVLWGLIKWQTTESKTVKRTLGTKSLKNIQNFFRVKALQRFYSEGLIDKINYVPSIEDIKDD